VGCFKKGLCGHVMTNKSSDLVSIIIPVYNASLYLRETIDSVISQSHSNWELFLVNNCSTDGSAAIIDDYCFKDSRILRLDTEFNTGGPSVPRNLGASIANGQFLAFLDADDCWKLEKLALQLEFMNETQADIVHCGASIINSASQQIGNRNNFKKFKYIDLFLGQSNTLMIFNPIILSSALLKNTPEVLFREDSQFHAIEDWLLWIELSLRGKKIRMNTGNLLSYRIHDNSASSLDGEKQYLKGFYLYSLLLVENKINLSKFLVLSVFHVIRIFKYRILGRHLKR
jgi:teichuronic acid biosynthesis glycosyltransferase TuaG